MGQKTMGIGTQENSAGPPGGGAFARALALGLLVALGGCGWAEWPSRGYGREGVPGPSPYDSQNLGSIAGESIVVQKGDTLFGLARRHKVDLQALIDANRLRPPYTLRVGQKIAIPRGSEVTVARGDTIYSIAQNRGVDPYELARVNRLQPPYRLTPGERLALPAADAAPPQPAPPAQRVGAVSAEALPDPTAAPASSPTSSSAASTPGAPSSVAAPSATTAAPAPAAPHAEPAAPPHAENVSLPPAHIPGKGFLWPVRGKVISSFGAKEKGLRNDGINIAAPLGAPVRAAQDGTVVYAGNELRGFGNLLLVRHENGWVTAYAHADRLLVQRGDTVRRGQIIARVGSTGAVAAPQLHFEIRKGKRAQDPASILGA